MKKKLLFITVFFTFIDQLIKFFVSNNLTYLKEYNIIDNFFYISYCKNKGGAWSILNNNVFLLIIIGIIVLYIIYLYLKNKKLKNIEVISYSIIIGGIIGNLIDRIINGYVIDYLGFIIFNYEYPIFNLADMGIVIGVIILIIDELRCNYGNRSIR